MRPHARSRRARSRPGTGARRREATMSNTITLNRRGFVVSTAAALGGFTLGWKLPGSVLEAQAQATLPSDVGIWVQIYPDDTTVVRIARSEMGQGTLTGLAQLVAEELDCN